MDRKRIRKGNKWLIVTVSLIIFVYLYSVMALDQVTAEEWAYIAGFLDADGCFHMPKRRGRVHYRTIISFANTNKNAIEWLSQKLLVNTHRIHHDKRPNTKPLYTCYIWTRANVLFICEQVHPFLIVKKKRCELFMEYLKLHNFRQGMREPLLPRETEIYNELKQFNKLGED